MTKQPPTSSGMARLSELARHVVVPSGIVSTGWPAVRDKCRDLGITFDSWQDGTGRLILAKREDGLYATTVGGVVISIPRQVGKTFLIGAIVFALCLLFPNLTVIWTAHRLRTAAETFSVMQGMTRRAKIKPFVAKVVLGSGDEEILFHNGSRILFGARERGFGRGFAEVDVLVFDEAQILTENAIDDMVPATNQAPNPLILFTGTPPKPTDPGEVFKMKRAEALSGESDDTVYIEFSADLGADPLDRDQWRKANPSYPKRTPVAAMLRMKKNLTEESFIREALGIWDLDDGGGAFSFEAWKALADADAERGEQPVFGVATAPDRSWAAVAVAWERPDGNAHVMLADYRRDATWVKARVEELRTTWRAPVLLDTASHGLVDDADEPSEGEQAEADNGLSDRILAGTVRHGNELALSIAVRGAKWKPRGDTRVLDRKGSIDISPLRAASLAVHGIGAERAPNIW
ncbi:MAG: hypothetical protein JWO98_4724 [Frankiales bacterium]|nr:hypothetical protein [Frankiales bacterium]